MKRRALNRDLGGAATVLTAMAATLASSTAFANLETWVNAPSTNANGNQKQIGTAVQNTCRELLKPVRNLSLSGAATSQAQDLLLRCNEMVHTANALEGVGATARSLGYTSNGQLLGALQQISGEELAAQGSLSTQVSSGQFANIGGRLNALRLGGASVGARGRVAALTPVGLTPDSTMTASLMRNSSQSLSLSGAAPYSTQNSAHDDALNSLDFSDRLYSNLTAANTSSPSAGSSGFASPWGWFTEGNYSMGDHEQTGAEDAFDFDSFSVTVGADYNFGTAVVGASLGYDNYKADFNTSELVSGGDVTVKGISGSFFGAWFPGNFGVNGIASFGKLSSDVERRVNYSNQGGCANCGAPLRTLSGSPDGDYIAIGAGVNYDFEVGALQLSPSVSFSYRKVDIDGYDEHDSAANGGLGLRYDEQSIKSLRSIVGFQAAIPLSKGFGVLTPSFKTEWHHEFKDDARTMRARYLLEDTLQATAAPGSGCISCFNFSTDEADADFAVAGVGMTALFAQRLQTYVYYETLLGAANLSSHSIALGLRGQF